MTLNEAADITKKGLVYFLLFVLLYVFAENFYRAFIFIYAKAFPEPPPPPTFTYGRIERTEIRTLPIDISNVEFRQELTTPKLPVFPPKVNIYQIESPRVSVAKEEKFKNTAVILGFNDTAKKISDSRRLWVDLPGARQLEANVYFEQLNLETRKTELEKKVIGGIVPQDDSVIEVSKNFFRNIGLWNEDIQKGEYKVTPAYIEEGLVKSTDIPFRQTLKFVAVFPQKLAYTESSRNAEGEIATNGIYKKIYSHNPTIPRINTLIARVGEANRQSTVVVDAEYTYFKTTPDLAEYPIMNSQTAWENLISGKASLTYIKEEGADFFAPNASIKDIETIDIREIELGYYIDNELLEYLQPIFIFRGKFTTLDRKVGNVIFYLPALDPQGTL